MSLRFPGRLSRLPLLPGLLLVVAALAPAQADIGHWPFDKDPNGGPGTKKLDLFNLGLMGVKAWDADKPEPARQMESGRRRFESSGGKDKKDRGPKRLKVMALYPKGPAHRAKIQKGDIIVGVGQQRFTEGSFGPLADALLAAEAGNGVVLLQVERQTKKGPKELSVKVKIKKGGKAAADPISGKGRQQILKKALDWLARKQTGEGGFPATLSGANGQVVQTSLAGLAWISGGSSLAKGRHSKNIQKAYDFVLRSLEKADQMGGRPMGDANWNQTTWGYAHAAIFLGQLYAAKKSGKVKRELQRLVDVLTGRQEGSGGYAHGPGGKNALDYLELNIMACFVLDAFSVAHQAGCKVDMDVVKKYADYLEQCSGDDGGVGYAHGPGQKGHGNIGRTAGIWMGLRGVGRAEEAFTQKLRGYCEKNIGAVMGGHASLMQHIMLAGLAAQALGPESEKRYWEVMKRDLTLVRAPDGSIQPRPWHESLSMSSNSDVSVGDVWTTASWACVLGATPYKKRGGLEAWLGGPVPTQ